MNREDDEALSDLEARLRAWGPAEVPPELRARLLASRPTARRAVHWTRPALAGALALGLALLLLVMGRPGRQPGAMGDSTAALPGLPRTANQETVDDPKRFFGQGLTMNIYTGVPPGTLPAAWRLDAESAAEYSLLSLRAIDGKLPLKVDCQL